MSDSKKPSMLVMPNIDGMISDALSILQTEILRMKTKSMQGRPLDPLEAKLLQGYIRSLSELAKEDRERAKDVDLTALTTEELVALLGAKAPRQLQAKADSDES